MRKTIVVLVIVAALVILVAWANRNWPGYNAQAAQEQIAPSGSASLGADDAAIQTLPLADLDGKQMTLGDYRGKVVLVDFWATWCEPCLMETPSLIDLQQKYGSRGFVVLGMAMDEEGTKVVAPFVAKQLFNVNGQQEPMNFRVLIGSDDIADKFGGVEGTPTLMLFARNGQKVQTLIGLSDYDEIDKAIQAQL